MTAVLFCAYSQFRHFSGGVQPLPSCRFASSHLPQGDGFRLCRKVFLLDIGVPLEELARRQA